MSSDLERMRSCIGFVDEFFDGICAPLRAWMPRLQVLLSVAEVPISGTALIDLALPGAKRVFETADRPFSGVGFCGSDAILTEGNTLAWWLGPEQHLLASASLGPGGAVMDFGHLEWFRTPRDTGKEHITGPFIDSLCSKQLTLTASVPLLVDGEFWGVGCADVLVESIEQALFSRISSLAGASLVNAHGQVVVSANPDYEVGDRLSGVTQIVGEGDASTEIVRSQRYPFALVAPKR